MLNIILISSISLAIGFFLIIFSLIKNKKKKVKKVMQPIIQQPVIATVSAEDEPHPNIIIKSENRELYEKFMQEYNPKFDFKFDNIGYRKGAIITCQFGIAEGFKYDAFGNMEWGYVRLHTGVDRARGGTYEFKDGSKISDVVQVPFKFNRSSIVEYKNKHGQWTSYGTLTSLYNDEYGFEMRIGHMHPTKNIIPWSYNRLKHGLSFEPGWILGSAGTCGDSSGPHTHTEFISIGKTCPVFDTLLEEKYGQKALVEYTKNDIIKEYKKYKHFEHASDKKILKDWQAVKEHRGAIFINKYKYTFKNRYGTIFTRYSSSLLFNGL